MNKRRRGFTLLEMMAVVLIIAVMVAGTSLMVANAQPSVKVRKDAGAMVAFLRNMWDRSRATGSALILYPDFNRGTLSYQDPLTGLVSQASFDSEARVLAVRINDRFYTANSFYVDENGVPVDSALYISEGRGLTRIAVLFAIPSDDGNTLKYVHLCSLNLITGQGGVMAIGDDQMNQVHNILAGG